MGILNELSKVKHIFKKEEKKSEPDIKELISVLRAPTDNKALETIAKALQQRDTEISTVKEPMSIKTALEKLAKGSLRKSINNQERIDVSQVWLSRAETMYRLDPIIFASVNKVSRLISSPKLIVISDNSVYKKAVEDFLTQYRVRSLLRLAVKDTVLYGFSVMEKERKASGVLQKLDIIDPKTIDYKQDSMKLAVDEQGPVGYEVKNNSGQSTFLPRKDAVHLRLFTLGEECMGISPLEPVFKVSWIRMNLEDSLGEAIYRHGYPIYYFKIGTPGQPATPQMTKDAKEVLADFKSASEVILPDWVSPGVLETARSQLGQMEQLLTFFMTQLVSGMEIPIGYLTGGTAQRGQLEVQNLDFEKAIASYQLDIIDQITMQLLPEVPGWDNMDPKPTLMFQEISPENKLLRTRRLGVLSQRGLLTRDDSLENQIRTEEDLPSLPGRDEKCVFEPKIKCPVRKTQTISYKDLASFCNVCHLRKEPLQET